MMNNMLLPLLESQALYCEVCLPCNFASLEDKHYCKVGQPNYPLAVVEHAKAALVHRTNALLLQTMTSRGSVTFKVSLWWSTFQLLLMMSHCTIGWV